MTTRRAKHRTTPATRSGLQDAKLPEITAQRADNRVAGKPPLLSRLFDAAALAADASALFAFVIWYNALLLDKTQYFSIAFYGVPTFGIAMYGIAFAAWSFIAARAGLAAPFDSLYRYPLLVISAVIAFGSLLILIATQDVKYVLCISTLWLAFLHLSTKQMHIDHYEVNNGVTAFIYHLLTELRQIAAIAFAVLTIGWCFDIYIHRAAIDMVPLSQMKHLYHTLIFAQSALDTKIKIVDSKGFVILIVLLGLKYSLRRSRWPDMLGKGVKAVQHVAGVAQMALIIVFTIPVLGMVPDGPLATLRLIIKQDFTNLRRDIRHSIQTQVLSDMYDHAWVVAPQKVTEQLVVSQDIERRWALLEQSNREASQKYDDLFKSPLPADALAQRVDTDSLPTFDPFPDASTVGEDTATFRRLHEARDSLTKSATAIAGMTPPKWLDGLKEDFVKRILTQGFDVFGNEELLKQIAIDHPFAGMFLDAIKSAGADSALEAIRPTVDRLAAQSLLEPQLLLPQSIAMISQVFANKNEVREVSFDRGIVANPSRAFAESERELAALQARMKTASDRADEEYRLSYVVRVRMISDIRADFIRLKDLYGNAGLYDKLDAILENAFQKVSHRDASPTTLSDLTFMEKHWPDEVAVILSQHVGSERQLRSSEWARRAYESSIEAARQRHLQEVRGEFGREEGRIEVHGK